MSAAARTIPEWLPAWIRADLAGKTIHLDRLPEQIRRRMRSPDKIRVSEHAARYRVVTEEPHTGPWRHELSPHTVKIMDTYGLPWVREVWLCGVDQSGKTNTAINCLHWAADVDPGNIFYLMPTEATSDKVTSEKLIPLVRASRVLKRYVSGRDADIGLARIKLSHGVVIRPAHANSAASMATFAAKHCIGDEIDKYPERTGREASPIDLIRKRNRLYRGRYKRLFCSTPAQLFIWKGLQACPQIWEIRHRCPHCGELFRPTGESLDIPAGLTPEEITAETPLAYHCTACGAAITEEERLQLLRAADWVCTRGADLVRPSRVGFHHRAWDCLDVPLHEIAAHWLRAKTGGVVEKVAYANGYEAMDYEFEQADRKEDFILRLVDSEHPRGLVPRDTAYLILVADTQQLGFHYAVFAFGYGDALPMAKIEHGFVDGFRQLNDLAAAVRLDADGGEHRIGSGWIDSGGGTNPARPQHSRTSEVYRFCRAHPFWRPIKGLLRLESGWGKKRMDFYPARDGRAEPIPGGLTRYNLNVTLYKDELAGKLAIEPNDPGAILLDAATTSDYARQLCSEYRDDAGRWHCPSGKPNHQWDCLVYALAAADIIGVRRWQRTPARPAGPIIYSKGIEL